MKNRSMVNVKHKRSRNRLMSFASVAMLSAVLLSLGTQIYNPAVNASDSNHTAKSPQSKYEVKTDDAALLQAVKDAKAAGVTVTQGKTKSMEVAKAYQQETLKSIKADYDKQQKALENSTAKQKKNNEEYAAAKAKYDKAKADYDKAMVQYQKDEAAYKAAKAQYDKDYAAYKKAEAEYQAALTQYNKDYVAYQQKKADYEKKLKQYNSDYAAWQEQINEYNNNGQSTNGVDPNKIQQQLTLGHETNAVMKVSNISSKANAKLLSKDQFNTVLSDGDLKAGFQSKSMELITAKENAGITGKVADVEYTNLSNSVYASTKIKKIKVTLSNLGANEAKKGMSLSASPTNRPDNPSLGIMQDPSETLWYLNSNGIDYSVSYFDGNGKKISVTKNSGYITVGSLNARYVNSKNEMAKTGLATHREGAKALSGVKAQGLQGSTITNHNGDLYSDIHNDVTDKSIKNGVTPSSWKGWDSPTSKNSIIGAGLLNLTGGDLSVRFHTGAQTRNTVGDVWATISTTIPKAVLPKPPVKPTPPTEPKKPTEPKAPTKPTAPKAPVKKVEKATYTLTKLVINEVKEFSVKLIERT